ncbi:MAG: winged helix-turn-helix domain-containing protein [Archaeoglobales archaeon]|nr:MAG: winged helix-turn-helix domain-containing protein [Archaeoglobales archaeon]
MQRYVYPVDLTEVEKELEFIAKKLKVSKAKAIREAIRWFAEELKGLEVVEIRSVSKEQAKREILEYIKGKERVTTDEIANDLRLDFSLVNEILMELWSECYVEPEN